MNGVGGLGRRVTFARRGLHIRRPSPSGRPNHRLKPGTAPESRRRNASARRLGWRFKLEPAARAVLAQTVTFCGRAAPP